MNRRHFVKSSTLATAGVLLSGYAFGGNDKKDFPLVRIAEDKRKFRSKAVERVITDIKDNIGNKELAWVFGNCFPNTLDTTVDFSNINNKPDTYVITGDIDAMWLRDSSAQVWPYLPLCKEDPELKALIKGVINRQVKCILKDAYANAFYKDENKVSDWKTDQTAMKPGIHERKWEIDSLCYPIRLAHGYWLETGETDHLDADWKAAMNLVVQTFTVQQRMNDRGPYSFMRSSPYATDSVPMGGYGYPARPNGLICSMFRPSDDATIYPYLIPSNIFAVDSLHKMAAMMTAVGIQDTSAVYTLAGQVEEALLKTATVKNDQHFAVYAYETNGYGSYNLMDDANVPSLLSLPYLLGDNNKIMDMPTYNNTRKFLLSEDNPFFFRGKAGEGIGGPHVGLDMIWPISIIMRGLTSNNDAEIKLCLGMLQQSHAGTGFMHESFHKDDATKFSRSWFAWANTLFGEFVWKVYRERKHLLD